ncbi:hypothetical protein NPIL_69941 [Nephila pilipes]|uniref:Uncharacterized protein n=1 Tax=Nephila pilipes TaxID=299642 RepID=A0A8X6PMW3_NEPPI|nr:hypothetical protein NPIL_69941 [Nephila pilipes]
MPPQETFCSPFNSIPPSTHSVFFRGFGVCVPCNNNICKLENFWRCYYLKTPFPSPPPIATAPSEKHLVLSRSPMPIKGTAGFKSAILPPPKKPPCPLPFDFSALSDSCTCLIRLGSLLRKNEAHSRLAKELANLKLFLPLAPPLLPLSTREKEI